jgi:hypothetical protein
MINRMADSSSAVPEQIDRSGRGARRAASLPEFQDMVRGASEQVQDSPAGKPPAALRFNHVRQQERGLRQPDAPKAVLGAEPASVSSRSSRVADNEATPRSPEVSAAVSSESAASLPQPSAAAAPAGNPFVRSADTTAPHLPRFSEVPEQAKYPFGPYRQAPPESGGDWWFVNPFTGPTPWLALDAAKAPRTAALEAEPIPIGFQEVFGARPQPSDFANRSQYGPTLARWEQDMTYFQQSGIPDGFDETQLEAAATEFEAWGLGRPAFYEGRYGWRVRFPDSQLPTFETTPETALLVPHIVIAQYQVRSIQEGMTPSRYHPWLPERLLPA